jgi:hypothetical protein
MANFTSLHFPEDEENRMPEFIYHPVLYKIPTQVENSF